MLDELVSRFSSDAKEFPREFRWLNTDKSLSIEALRGHIVILDFWTYCCINCMHMLPILARIEDRYRDRSVIVIGVHSAKFENEEDPVNIQEAINRYEVRHPVIVDERRHIWKLYGIDAWPTIVIIDPEGRIVYKRAGETDFGTLDDAVSRLLESYSKAGLIAKESIAVSIPGHKRKAGLLYPGKMAFSPTGREFVISDSNHNLILIIDKDSGKVIKTIGEVEEGLADGKFDEARFSRPQGVIWPEKDTIYVADTENHALRKVDIKEGRVDTLAGNGVQALFTGFETKQKGATARFSSPWDLTVMDRSLLIAMAGLHQIWLYELDTDYIGPFAGSGYENLEDGSLVDASFAQPSGLAIVGRHIYVVDSEASAIRSISLDKMFVSTLAGAGLFAFGNTDGKLSEARLQHPLGICADKEILYIADTYNHAIRQLDIQKREITTLISKNSKSVCRFDDPECDTLGLYEPSDVKLLGNVLYIVDTNNHLVRTFDLKRKILETMKIG